MSCASPVHVSCFDWLFRSYVFLFCFLLVISPCVYNPHVPIVLSSFVLSTAVGEFTLSTSFLSSQFFVFWFTLIWNKGAHGFFTTCLQWTFITHRLTSHGGCWDLQSPGWFCCPHLSHICYPVVEGCI